MITTIVHIGAEKGAASEVKELLGIDAKVLEGAIEFSCSKEQLFTYCYLSQAAIRVLLEDDPKLWLEDGMTFCVRSPNKQEEYDVGAELNKDNKCVKTTTTITLVCPEGYQLNKDDKLCYPKKD